MLVNDSSKKIASLTLGLVTLLGVTLLGVAAYAGTTPQQPAAPVSDAASASNAALASNPAAAKDPLVARGHYIALAADCGSCHTAPGGQPYAGGYPLKSDFGVIYGPNITQDVKTGIGGWTKADFEKALRQGRSKDGSYLYPAMPYDAYTKMTAADMDALWAYMRTVKAVNYTPPKNTLPFPLTVRSGLAVWQGMYFKPGPFVPNAAKDAQWNRGAYLVDALGHCTDCHTPRNLAQGPETQHLLGGAKIEGWYAPDISNDPGSKLHDWSTDELAKFLKSGTMPGNVKAFGPMQETVHDSLRFLKDGDLHAMAVYLKDQPAGVKMEAATKAKWPADRMANGKLVYENNCSSCHQSNGKGIPGSVPALADNDSVTAGEPYNVVMAMLEGFAPQGTWGAMGSFAHELSDDQIADVTNYVRTAWGNNAIPNATPWSVSSWRKNANTLVNAEADALLCPSLATDVLQPALAVGPAALKQAAADRSKMSALVGQYRTARPQSSKAQVVEALSTAYCRAVASDHLSTARATAQMANFAQSAATSLERKPTKTST
jgi:mono/diheme cytochrome c family protein